MKALTIILLWLFVSQVLATASVPSLNDCPDMIFIDGNENESMPSAGAGGGFPGSFTRSIVVDLTSQTFYYYVPSSYQSNEPMPLMALWHGSVFAGGGPAAAEFERDFWQAEAEAQGFIVVAQAIRSNTGCNPCGWDPVQDSQILAAILGDMEARYNIETTRRYVWGFSAGGHVMHAIALNNADFFAGYAISAGVLAAYANSQGYTPANAVRTIPVFISVGSTDTLLPFSQDDQVDFIQAGWEEGRNYWLDVFVGGHTVPNDIPTKAWDKICISTVLD